jgi:hypothetical protein
LWLVVVLVAAITMVAVVAQEALERLAGLL